jgi:kynurenine formamidase
VSAGPAIGVEAAAPAALTLSKGALEALSRLDAGLVFDLAMPVDERMPQWPPEQAARFSRRWVRRPASSDEPGVRFAVEAIEGSLHTSTHIDALVHAQSPQTIAGGGRTDDVVADGGHFTRLGVDTIAPILAPFVLVDVCATLGVEVLDPEHEISVADLAGAAVAPGSVALVRTGAIRRFSRGDEFLLRQPGLSVEAATWLADRGVVAIGSDTAGTEPLPMRDPTHSVHEALLVERGVYLIENLNLEQLAAARHARGLFVCLPLKLTGATGSWVRPVAIV